MPARSKDRQIAADAAAIERSSVFTVVRFVGRSPADGAVPRAALWDRREFAAATHGSRAAALAAAEADYARGCPDGRRPCLYAVTPTGATVHVK